MKPLRTALLCAASALAGAAALLAAQQVTTSQRIPMFENEDVKVWKSIVLPNQPLTMHRHEHPRIIVALRGGTMRIVEDKGGSVDHPWETGKAYWLTTSAPGTMHADVNAGTAPMEVMVIELEHEK